MLTSFAGGREGKKKPESNNDDQSHTEMGQEATLLNKIGSSEDERGKV